MTSADGVVQALVAPQDIQAGDVMVLGGHRRRVSQITRHRSAWRLVLSAGEVVTLTSRVRYTVWRRPTHGRPRVLPTPAAGARA